MVEANEDELVIKISTPGGGADDYLNQMQKDLLDAIKMIDPSFGEDAHKVKSTLADLVQQTL